MENRIIRREGISLDNQRSIYNGRSDMCNYVTHLTKPQKEELSKVFIEKNDKGEKIKEINSLAVNNLIRILKTEYIYGSGKDGFIINGGKKTAVCFQDVPFTNLKESVDLALQPFMKGSTDKLRYCGVGIAFDKFIIYEHGGRPVIYEEKEKAKELLNYNEDEYWRIVNLRLAFNEPIEFDIEPCDMNLEFNEYEQEISETTIVDFMYEREWRIPNNFKFNLVEDLTAKKNISLVFPTRDAYNYFIEQIDDPYLEQNILFKKYSNEEIYQEDKLENISIYGMGYYYDSYDNVYYIPRQELYKEDFLGKLDEAIELDGINLRDRLVGYNMHLKVKIVILEELDLSTNN